MSGWTLLFLVLLALYLWSGSNAVWRQNHPDE